MYFYYVSKETNLPSYKKQLSFLKTLLWFYLLEESIIITIIIIIPYILWNS